MSQEVTRIKKRIKSVTGAYKVTSAMKLVSTVKLKKWKNKMLANKEYVSLIKQATESVLSYSNNFSSPLLNENKTAKKKLFIILSSTLGLCGSYNNNIFKLAESNITKDDDAIILGGKGMSHFINGEFVKINDFNEYSSINDDSIISSLTRYITNKYSKGEYKEIHLIYSKYKNSLAFIPTDECVLPIKIDKKETSIGYPPIMEPSPNAVMESLIPLYMKTNIYSKFLESEVCEHAARSNAMENATKNAEELLDNLQIEFNKARQGAITQEIIEIVAASETV